MYGDVLMRNGGSSRNRSRRSGGSCLLWFAIERVDCGCDRVALRVAMVGLEVSLWSLGVAVARAWVRRDCLAAFNLYLSSSCRSHE